MSLARLAFLSALSLGSLADDITCPELWPYGVHLVFAHPFLIGWTEFEASLKAVYPQVFADLTAWHQGMKIGIVAHGNKEDADNCTIQSEQHQCCEKSYGRVTSDPQNFETLVQSWTPSVQRILVPEGNGSDALQVISALDAENLDFNVFPLPPEDKSVIRQVIVITDEPPLYGPDGDVPIPDIETHFPCRTKPNYNSAQKIRESLDLINTHFAVLTGNHKNPEVATNWTTAIQKMGFTEKDCTQISGVDFKNETEFRDELLLLVKNQLCKIAVKLTPSTTTTIPTTITTTTEAITSTITTTIPATTEDVTSTITTTIPTTIPTTTEDVTSTITTTIATPIPTTTEDVTSTITTTIATTTEDADITCPELWPYGVHLVFAHPFLIGWTEFEASLKAVYPQVFADLTAWHQGMKIGIVAHGNKEVDSACSSDSEGPQCCVHSYGPVTSDPQNFETLVQSWTPSVQRILVPEGNGSDALSVISGLDAENLHFHVFPLPPEDSSVIRQVIVITDEPPLYGPDGDEPIPDIETNLPCRTKPNYNSAERVRESLDLINTHFAVMTGNHKNPEVATNWTTAIQKMGFTGKDSTQISGVDFKNTTEFRDALLLLVKNQLCKIAVYLQSTTTTTIPTTITTTTEDVPSTITTTIATTTEDVPSTITTTTEAAPSTITTTIPTTITTTTEDVPSTITATDTTATVSKRETTAETETTLEAGTVVAQDASISTDTEAEEPEESNVGPLVGGIVGGAAGLALAGGLLTWALHHHAHGQPGNTNPGFESSMPHY